MFNISKNTFWFIIIIISIICILCLFYSNNCCSSHNDDYYRYNKRKLSFNNNKLIPIIIENKTNETNKSNKTNQTNETNETIRKKQNRKHTESKKIFISPKKDKNIISIEKIKKQLTNKLTNNKTIKKQYVSNSLNQVTKQNQVITNKEITKQNQEITKQNQEITNKEITKQNQVSKQNQDIQRKLIKPSIRFFFAEWCGHCQEFKPTWFKLKKLYSDKINFIEVDCSNNNPGLEYVQYFPTISIYDKNDNFIENYEDDRSNYTFRNFLNNLIK